MLNYTNPGKNTRLTNVYLRSVIKYGTGRKILNALRTEYAYRRRATDVKSRPYILFLEPLYYCNLDCPLCDRQVFPAARAGDAGKLPLAVFDRILDEIGDDLFQCQIFGQGEPLMNWKLSAEIIKRAHDHRIFTLLSTNATLISAEMAQEMVVSGLDHLVCAIDGVTQDVYEQYRVGGKVDDALAGLMHVVAALAEVKGRSSMTIEWQYLTHAGNLHEIDRARAMATKLGVVFRTAPLRGMEWDEGLEQTWLAPSDQRFRAGDYVNDYPCYFLWRSLVLNSNSKVSRCLVYQNIAQYSHLRDVSVMEAYNHPSVQAARGLFRRTPTSGEPAPQPCDGCGYFKRHHGAQPGHRNERLRSAQTG